MSYLRSVSAKMKSPLAKAFPTSCCAKPRSSAGSAVEEMTNSTGKFEPPGRGAGVVAMTWMPGTAPSLAKASGIISSGVRFRALHGFKPMPEKPPNASVSWKVCRVSGKD